MEDCPVDNCKEDSSLCRNVLSGSTEPCPGNLCYQSQLRQILIYIKERLSEIVDDKTGAKIPACGNLSEDQVAKDSMLQRVESTSPVITDIDDLIIDPYESEEEDEEKSG